MSQDFWTRRRQAVAREVRAEEAAVAVAEQAELEAALDERTDEELLTEAGLAPPEELSSPEAVREFLSSALPQRLKTRALRQLWRLNPVLANVDGLVDYGEDFTDSATVIENLQTTYQVGKGMLRHLEEMARQAEDVVHSEEPDAAPEELDEPPHEQPEIGHVAVVAQTEAVAEAQSDFDEPPFAPRRRMTFTFDEKRIG